MKVLLKTILLVGSLVFSTCVSASSASSSEDESLVTYRFKVKGHDFPLRVHATCLNPKVVSLDFSSVKLADEDLDVVFEALAEREKRLKDAPHCRVELIDLRHGTFSEDGFLRFLGNLQHGKKEAGVETPIYPDVRETILKIGLSLTDDFVARMEEVAPSTFAGGLQIIQ